MAEPEFKLPEDLNSWDKLVSDINIQQNIEKLLSELKEGKPDSRSYRSGILLFESPDHRKRESAALLTGKDLGRAVHRIDLSAIASKYIGETEKNLKTIFDKAEQNKWILFFDEADALFGKRTEVKDSHDRYANQEVSYLVQRIETYTGLTILGTNKKSNIDEAFQRRIRYSLSF